LHQVAQKLTATTLPVSCSGVIAWPSVSTKVTAGRQSLAEAPGPVSVRQEAAAAVFTPGIPPESLLRSQPASARTASSANLT
jgi:hypothetical protein